MHKLKPNCHNIDLCNFSAVPLSTSQTFTVSSVDTNRPAYAYKKPSYSQKPGSALIELTPGPLAAAAPGSRFSPVRSFPPPSVVRPTAVSSAYSTASFGGFASAPRPAVAAFRPSVTTIPAPRPKLSGLLPKPVPAAIGRTTSCARRLIILLF